MAVDVDREQALAYRIHAQQLARVELPPAALAVLDLGVPDTPYGSARLALAARTTAPLDDESLTLVWAARGAPHLHRRADLPAVAARLWPLGDNDAGRRIASSQVKGAASLGLTAFQAAADAFAAVVRAPMARGEVSTGVSARVPAAVTYACRACQATHISGSLFQQAGLAGGVQLEPVGGATRLAPIDGWPGVPERARDTAALVRDYLRLLGPATPAEVAAYLGTTQTELRRVWPDDLVEVRLAGRTTWLPPEEVAKVGQAPKPRLVRLLPPGDPYLQARDRDLVVPEKSRHAQVWRIISNPGVLLVDGEILGIWRSRLAGRKRLDITVAPFAALPGRTRSEVEAEAARLAAARGVTDVRVTVDE
ncbi:DNA glycosylase AlkZ-like family protein [Micromonospora sp. NPDC050417]|uniref:DNA glycosylase AlkZ-like family protein n=1 Tax=Micromonospora sp. NPDC050417 TaxID=3364280 RepID=UPI0037A8CBF6